jgi:hypothetical protein
MRQSLNLVWRCRSSTNARHDTSAKASVPVSNTCCGIHATLFQFLLSQVTGQQQQI